MELVLILLDQALVKLNYVNLVQFRQKKVENKIK